MKLTYSGWMRNPVHWLPVLLFLLAGCAPKPTSTLTIAINAGVEGDALKAAAVEWGDKSGTQVEVVELPYSNLFEKLLLDLLYAKQ